MGKGLEVSNSMGHGWWGPEARTLREGPPEWSMEGTLNQGSWRVGALPHRQCGREAIETGIVEEEALR